jgi:asparagine N-glycosylation enzyme membrane subunit Stt3
MMRGGRIAFWATFALILALAAGLRLANFQAVLWHGEVAPEIDGDASYHLHRSMETVRNWPRVPHRDPLMNWPAGAYSPWSDGYDLSAATFAVAVGGRHDLARAQVALALWPVILGLLLVWATLVLARTVLPEASWRGALLASALLCAMIPEAVNASIFGRMDHHVVEALILALLVTWALRSLAGYPAERPASPVHFELIGAAISGLGVFAFSGTPLYVAIALPVLLVAATRRGRHWGSGGWGLLGGAVMAAVLSMPSIQGHGRILDWKYPSLLQPLLLSAAGAAVLASAWIGAGSGASGRRRGALAALCAGGVVVILAVVGRALLGELRGGIEGWLLHQDPWIATIREFSPFLSPWTEGAPVWDGAYEALGWTLFFAPVAMAVVAIQLRRKPRVAALLYATAAIAALTLVQNRFARVGVPLLAVVCGIAAASGLRALGARWRVARWPVWAPALVLLAGIADPPTRGLFQSFARNRLEPVFEAALDLRDVPLPSQAAPGVLTNWSHGHHIEAMAGKPVVVNGFGSFLDEAAFRQAVEIFTKDGDALDAYMTSHRLGALVAGAATVGAEVKGAGDPPTFTNGRLEKEYMAGLPLAPLLIAGSAIPNWNVPHLAHLMPRYATTAEVAGLEFPLPYLWTYERVEGARVRGTAPAGTRVIGELHFTENRRPHLYKAYVDAAPDGSWELVLPLPSGLLRPAIRSEARWSISAAGSVPLRIAVPEAAVRGGAMLEVGALPGRVP